MSDEMTREMRVDQGWVAPAARPDKIRDHLGTRKPASANAAADNPGCDPYNTSGSFDRKKNWTRVGKR